MLNALRNNITRLNSNRYKLTQINDYTKSFIDSGNKNLLNKFSKLTFMTQNNLNNNNNNNQKIHKLIANKEFNFSKLKLYKITSSGFFTKKANKEPKSDGNGDEDVKFGKEPYVDDYPEFYEVLIEGVSKSPNLNEAEKTALIEKLQIFYNSYVELNEERKHKDWGEVYFEIVKRLTKEDNEKIREKFYQLVQIYKYNKKVRRRKRRKIYKKILKHSFLIFLIVLFLNIYYYKKGINNQENNAVFVKEMDSVIDWIYKAYKSVEEKLSNPYYSKLLPEQIVLPGQPPKKTLVINFENTLINYDYHLGSGMDCKGRPYLQKFLEELSPYYEIVVFSNFNDSHFVEPIVKSIDKMENKISYILGKEASSRYSGRSIKDLNYLNRDLKSVIAIDFKEENLLKHKNNMILLPAFNGEETDSEFRNIIPFLKEMAKKEVTDVRKEIEKYGNFKPYLNYYRSNPKYKALLPKEAAEKKA